MKIKVQTDFVNLKMRLPLTARAGDSGVDLQLNTEKSVEIHPYSRYLAPTGLRIQLPESPEPESWVWEFQIRPRSGMGKKGLIILNSPGTVDSGYTGEVFVSFYNVGCGVGRTILEPGERIAQGMLTKSYRYTWDTTTPFTQTERGDGGFGHTGA